MSEDDVLGYGLQLVDLAGRIGVAPVCRAFASTAPPTDEKAKRWL